MTKKIEKSCLKMADFGGFKGGLGGTKMGQKTSKTRITQKRAQKRVMTHFRVSLIL
jgi:hypothetical protein